MQYPDVILHLRLGYASVSSHITTDITTTTNNTITVITDTLTKESIACSTIVSITTNATTGISNTIPSSKGSYYCYYTAVIICSDC